MPDRPTVPASPRASRPRISRRSSTALGHRPGAFFFSSSGVVPAIDEVVIRRQPRVIGAMAWGLVRCKTRCDAGPL
jgi:hypothetical protein